MEEGGRRERTREMAAWPETQPDLAGSEDGRWGPWTKECGWHLKAGKSHETDSSLAPPEGRQLCQTLILAQWDFCETSDLQNWKITHVCCFEPLSSFEFVTAAIVTLWLRHLAASPRKCIRERGLGMTETLRIKTELWTPPRLVSGAERGHGLIRRADAMAPVMGK